MSKLMSFANEVRAEFSKMIWPSREELVGSVVVVCFLILVFAMVLGAMDGFFGYAIKTLFAYV